MAFASTGPLGFAVGFDGGVAGIDFSDGVNRQNIGTTFNNIHLGLHIDDVVFLLTGDFQDLQGSLDDYLAAGGVAIKWYFLENFHLTGQATLARYNRSAYNSNVTTFTTYTGGGVGGSIGWDVLASQGNGPFRMSVNVGANRYDFGNILIRQGNVTSNMDLGNNHLVGISFFTFLALDWYLSGNR